MLFYPRRDKDRPVHRKEVELHDTRFSALDGVLRWRRL